MIVVTGGAGFIGANFVLDWLGSGCERIVNLDKLTYAGNLESLSAINDNLHYTFVHGDIGDRELVKQLLVHHRPRAVINFAAESHVDRSIHACTSLWLSLFALAVCSDRTLFVKVSAKRAKMMYEIFFKI